MPNHFENVHTPADGQTNTPASKFFHETHSNRLITKSNFLMEAVIFLLNFIYSGDINKFE
jgi:hypothetical protein